VPQTRTYQVDDVPESLQRPDVELTTNPPGLMAALKEASLTCDHNSARYALSCIRLRGETGGLAATDSRQLLEESGFSFPWDDDVLIPGR